MKPLLQFLRTTFVGGLLFLVPIIVVVVILEKAVTIARSVLKPLAEHLHVKSIIGLDAPMFLAVAVVVLVCFLAGLLARTAIAKRAVRGLESSALSKVPGYQLLKGVAGSLLGVEPQEAYTVVLARPDDAWQIGFQVETLDNGLVTVFIPDTPNPQSGAIFFLSPDRIMAANIPLAAAARCLMNFGAGSKTLLRSVSFDAAPAS